MRLATMFSNVWPAAMAVPERAGYQGDLKEDGLSVDGTAGIGPDLLRDPREDLVGGEVPRLHGQPSDIVG